MRSAFRAAASQARCPGSSPASFSCLLTSHRNASGTTADGEGGRGAMTMDAVARPMGYGPFSATAKARVLREQAEAKNAAAVAATSSSSSSSAQTTSAGTSTVMHNVTLQTNLSLRLSLAGLPHPSQLQECAYSSPEWRRAFVRLYRTILRLHNKTVAVSLNTARGAGAAAAVSAVTGVRSGTGEDGASSEAGAGPAAGTGAEDEDYLLRYLLTPEQQEFGNRFVQGEFARHMDADAVSAAIFYASWYDYVLQLASGVTSREMTEKEKRLLSDDQKEKLNTLRGAFVDLRVSKEPQYMP